MNKPTRTITETGSIVYMQDGVCHREHGPYYINADGCMIYQKHGRYHRENGPAAILSDGYMEYWIEGYRVKEGHCV